MRGGIARFSREDGTTADVAADSKEYRDALKAFDDATIEQTEALLAQSPPRISHR